MSMKNIFGIDAQRDRGAVMIWFAASVVVSLGMGALVIDMGALWTERRQLQNGADAAALAVGIECAGGPCTSDPQTIAKDYATANTNDRSASVDKLCVKAENRPPNCSVPPEVPAGAFGFAEVVAGTSNSSGGSPGDLKFLFAPIFGPGNSGKHVTARSVAAWGPPGKAPIMPIVLTKCAVEPFRQPSGTMMFSDQVIMVTIHDTTKALTGNEDPEDDQSCNDGKWPAGFGYTGSASTGCRSEEVVLDPLVPGSTRQTGTIKGENNGNSIANACDAELKRRFLANEPTILPVMYDRVGGQGSNILWKVDGFVKVVICAWDLGGNRTYNGCSGIGIGNVACAPPPPPPPEPTDPNNGEPKPEPKPKDTTRICGIFEPYTLTDGTIGGSSDYGTRIIQLVG